MPVGVYAQVEDDDNLSVEAVIGSIDGKCIIRDKIMGSRANAQTWGKIWLKTFGKWWIKNYAKSRFMLP